jgi:hypothetical protein
MTSATEPRFALPLILLGIVGCAALVPVRWSDAVRRPERRWVIGTVVAALVVFAIGSNALSHPAPPGGVSVATCAAL